MFGVCFLDILNACGLAVNFDRVSATLSDSDDYGWSYANEGVVPYKCEEILLSTSRKA